MKEIRDPVSMQSVGAMIVTFRADHFQDIQSSYEQSELAVFNESGTVIFDSAGELSTGEMKEEQETQEFEEKLKAYVLMDSPEKLNVISYLKKTEAAKLPAGRVLMIIAVGFGAFFVSEWLVKWYLRRVSTRLDCILNGMTRVMGGDLTARLDVAKNGDELDVIALHFNEMCEKLDQHIQKSYLAEIEQKNAEMAALQSQINPHFLYNTLEAIRMKAICNGDQEVGKMLYSMAVTFRSQLKEADVITLAQELHYCKKYLELFEYRYPKQFQFGVDCPLEYMQVPIIKFVLQPVIENYFIHGIRMRDSDNFIKIMVRKREEGFAIIVEDNGRGMTEEEIEEKSRQLRENKMDKTKSIGIANVNRRIKAVYGKRYGLEIEQVKTGGLRVILTFRPPEGENDDEESNDRGR